MVSCDFAPWCSLCTVCLFCIFVLNCRADAHKQRQQQQQEQSGVPKESEVPKDSGKPLSGTELVDQEQRQTLKFGFSKLGASKVSITNELFFGLYPVVATLYAQNK